MDGYQILAVFPGDGPERSVPLRLSPIVVANLPGYFVTNAAPQDVSEELLIEIYGCAGVKDVYKHNILVAYIGKI